MTRIYHPVKGLILKYLPTFCYQTLHEIITFLEQIDENVNIDTVKVTLSELKKTNKVKARKTIRPQQTHTCKKLILNEYVRME